MSSEETVHVSLTEVTLRSGKETAQTMQQSDYWRCNTALYSVSIDNRLKTSTHTVLQSNAIETLPGALSNCGLLGLPPMKGTTRRASLSSLPVRSIGSHIEATQGVASEKLAGIRIAGRLIRSHSNRVRCPIPTYPCSGPNQRRLECGRLESDVSRAGKDRFGGAPSDRGCSGRPACE